MDVGVVYYSKTGNTKKLAEAIAGAIGCTAADVSEFDTGKTYDIMYIGGAIYGGKLDPALMQFIEGIDPSKVKRAALFTTYAFGESATGMMKALLKEKGIVSEDVVYKCKGKFMFFNGKSPNAKELEDAGKFAQQILSTEL